MATGYRQKVGLLTHQKTFIEDCTTRYVALVGGYGCGKTAAFCVKAIQLAMLNVGKRGLLCEPTFSMVEDTLIPMLKKAFEEYNIPHEYKASRMSFVLHFAHGSTEILLRSAENYDRLVGLNLAFFGIDEVDKMKQDVAHAAWNQFMSRLRDGTVYQGFSTSTPEGYKFLYDFFVKGAVDAKGEPRTDRRIIHAKTKHNPFLPKEYIADLYSKYDEKRVLAYLEGQFVNLDNGAVYFAYDKEKNRSTLTAADCPYDELHIGMDFNIGHMAATVAVVRNGQIHFIDEFNGISYTEDMIKRIRHRYPTHTIYTYPDSSGQNGHTNASVSDVALLKQGGLNPRYHTKNPEIRNRVGAVNVQLCNGLGKRNMLVNPITCSSLCESLTRQGYTDEGKPDKSNNIDHIVDAMGYFVHYFWPVVGKGSIRVT